MSIKPNLSLKETNAKWLWAFLSLNALVFLIVFGGGDASAENLQSSWKLVSLKDGFIWVAIPIVCYILNGLIPSDLKAMIVFCRPNNPLPGTRVFTHLAPKDPRIDLAKIESGLDEQLPTEPAIQNNVWYRTYKKHEGKPSVAEAQRMFLLTRDLAMLSLMFLVVAVLGGIASGTSSKPLWCYLGALAGFAALSCTAAQNYGNRFALNALAEESASGGS